MLISASFQSHRHSQREGHTGPQRLHASQTFEYSLHPPPPPLSCKSLWTNMKRYLCMDCIDHHVWSNKLVRVNLRKGMGRRCFDEYWMESFIVTMERAGQDCHRPVSLEITPHLPNSDKFNSNPSLKCSPAQTGGRKVRICRLYRKSLN